MRLVCVQVYVGRQHHIAVEVGEQQFELVLNNQPGTPGAAGSLGTVPKQQALPMPKVSPGAFALGQVASVSRRITNCIQRSGYSDNIEHVAS